ncbi:homoserine O-acetyltransferase-like protein [Thermothelomyces thermophilus ATCC 42464]|uniref:Homoserine O-acetyltransferase-like protein n=1 Tax=Thermothelomyces thermophilus (strain ATCC 42464 / BCRC 31852 / DSM 1799) TaxID=573729 RepID=G2Q541_THET4|nr:homoserine O-acetyltransferase-like protein [Thermothelomyces thermophilus ATCC 42464]AEO54579.1 homoserine O-acetyltransferase-like protein [Thermothelomyces thermophilus ATCC 42464]
MRSRRAASTLRHAQAAVSDAVAFRSGAVVRPVCCNAAPASTRRFTAATTAAPATMALAPPGIPIPNVPRRPGFRQQFAPRAPARRCLHGQPPRRSGAPSNPAIQFPCLDALENRSATLERQASARSDNSGPEPHYTVGVTKVYHCKEPLLLDHGGHLHEFDIAYETWGQMNSTRSNVILLHTGLSASSHAHSTAENPQPGWWEKFIGPGLALDTNKYFVICTNVIGGCYGSTGPSSIDPLDGQRYATRFPILTIQDMVRAQFRLLDHLGVDVLYASVGSSMGGMQSLAAGVEFPSRVGRIVSISACARSHPYSIAMRYVQRRAILNDPNWNRGFYYGRVPPHVGMKLAREIATITYRSGPEWEQRFGRRRADPSMPPALCPDFLVETYLDHAGEKFCLTYDANSLLYVSKAMDLFDLGRANQLATAQRRAERLAALSRSADKSPSSSPSSSSTTGSSSSSSSTAGGAPTCSLTLPDKPYEEQPQPVADTPMLSALSAETFPPHQPQQPPADLVAGLAPLRHHPVLVLGVASDILFPAWQQREVAEALRRAGNDRVEHHELSEVQSLFGHDTFLLDVEGVGGAVKNFLG